MTSNEITWQVVPNTVQNRLLDLSLIHKLVRCRKLQRRTKAMNTNIKKFQTLKTYNEYVKMKTTIIRNLSDDSETDDDDDSLTYDDYDSLYKSDTSLKMYITNMSMKNRSYLFEETSDDEEHVIKDNVQHVQHVTNNNVRYVTSDGDIMSDILSKKVSTPKSKRKSCKSVNVGWQEVIKTKKSKSANPLDITKKSTFTFVNPDYPLRDDVQRDSQDDVPRDSQDNLNMSDNHRPIHTYFKEDNLSQDNAVSRNDDTCINEKIIASHIETNLNETVYNNVEQEVNSDRNLSELILFKEEYVEEPELDENECNEVSESSKTSESVKEDLASILNNKTTNQDFKESFLNIKEHPDENQFNWSNKKLETEETEETSLDENKSNRFSEIQPLFNGNTNQPKDSGIDEDTEEEFSGDRKKISEEVKAVAQEIHKNIQNISPLLNHKNNSVLEISSPPVHSNLLLDGNDSSDKINTENMTLSPLKNENNRKEDTNEENQSSTSKQRLQPRVTRTEIINKKYRIVPYDTLFTNNSTNLESSIEHFNDEETLENMEIRQDIEDSMSPLTKKRLQQLRRLNLTVDSESSLSEDDDKNCNAENMRNKLLKRCKESSDISDSENENTNFKDMSSQLSEKLKNYKKSKIKKHKRKKALYPITMYEENEGTPSNNMESVKLIEYHKSISEHICSLPKSSSKKDSCRSINTSGNSLEKAVPCLDNEGNNYKLFGDRNLMQRKSNNLNCIGNQNFDQDGNRKGLNKKNLDSFTMKTINKDSGTCRRPNNLQELIEWDNLVYETSIPSFKFKDVQDDDIFILDIPSTVPHSELLGERIVLTHKKLKLGKQRYKVTFNDTDHVSCVFGTSKPHKSYRIVNIKPMARIVAHQKIVKFKEETQ